MRCQGPPAWFSLLPSEFDPVCSCDMLIAVTHVVLGNDNETLDNPYNACTSLHVFKLEKSARLRNSNLETGARFPQGLVKEKEMCLQICAFLVECGLCLAVRAKNVVAGREFCHFARTSYPDGPTASWICH